MNNIILNAVDADKFDAYGHTIFQAICALNAVRNLQELQNEKISLKRIRSTITMLDKLMQKDYENDK